MTQPRLFFSYGMTKTGSTLAFHLARAAMEQAGLVQPVLKVSAIGPNRKINFVHHLDDGHVEELLAVADALGHMIVLKTHTRPDPAVVRLIEGGDAIAHAIYRDPREMALSMLDHGHRARAAGKPGFAEIETLDDAIEGIRGQCDSLTAWLQMPDVRPLRYDTLAFDTVAATKAIIAQLGIDTPAEPVARSVLRTAFIQFNKGVPKRHEAEMSAEDSARFRDIFAPLFTRLLDTEPSGPPPGQPLLPLGTMLHAPA